MSDQTSQPMRDELLPLLVRYCEGELNEEEFLTLQDMLQSSAEARRIYIDQLELHARLAWDCVERETIDDRATTAAARRQPAARRDALVRWVHFFARPTPLSITVAALFIGLLVTAMAFIAAPIYRQLAGRGREPGEYAAPVFVAELTGSQGAVWGEGQIGVNPGAHLTAGHRIELLQGLAEFTFRDGAVVTVQGPAELRIDAAGVVALQQGKLLAHVPPAAVGFKVATPTMDIVDLGTDFGVDVQPGRSSEVHVLNGRVEVAQSAGASTAGGVILAQGQAWKLDAGAQRGQILASEPQRFALALAKPQIAIFQAGRPNPASGEIYDGVEDVMVMGWAPNWNFGAREEFDVGQWQGGTAHALLRFDLAPLRGKVKRLLSVTLRITPNSDAAYYPWREAGQIELHRVSDANAQWREGTFLGGTNPGAGEGESTWSRRSHPAQGWAGSPGASSPGLDFDAAPLAAATYTPQSNRPLEFRLRGDLSLVQAWIDGETNAGFLLRETTGAPGNRINFHSSESSLSAARPQLIVAYVPVSAEVVEEIEVSPPLP